MEKKTMENLWKKLWITMLLNYGFSQICLPSSNTGSENPYGETDGFFASTKTPA